MKPVKPYKILPNSRETSPSRIPTRPQGNSNRKLQNVGSSPQHRNVSSSETLHSRSRGSSPGTLSSRESESGSIERLDLSSHSSRIITTYNQADDNINVVVRVRPLNQKEIRSTDSSIVSFPGSGQLVCENFNNGQNNGQKTKIYSYNVVFEPAATQEDILQFSGVKRLIQMAVEGFRCTAFCYGQTGSGKTHTLTGPPGLFQKKRAAYSDQHGLVFRSFLYLFKLLEEKPGVHFILKASFLEIYNEKVIDLLNPGSARKPLAVRWSKKARGFFVENLFTVDCEELDDLTAVLEEGMRNRSVGSHNMNEYSSRSHTILTVHITSEQPAEGGVFLSRSGKINFVDLAGSEMTKKTQSEGKTLEEANNINKSLMVLGYCIASLSDPKRKNNHIPYRNSKLTKLLADSLAGNGVTLMIACISPVRSNLSETINTLRYAARAKKIKTKPVVLMDPREALILSLKRELNVLQSENEHLRSALHLNSENTFDNQLNGKRIIVTPPHVDINKLTELEGPELVEIVKLYVIENEALHKENTELFTSRETLLRDQELVCRENERLLKKLEDVNSVCCRSPIIQARTAFSAEAMGYSDFNPSITNIWTNSADNENKSFSEEKQIPVSIEKELRKRQIGNSLSDVVNLINGQHRHNSWSGKLPSTPQINKTDSANREFKSENSHREKSYVLTTSQKSSPIRRFSMAKSPSLPFKLNGVSTLPNKMEVSLFSRRGSRENSSISLADSLLDDSEWTNTATHATELPSIMKSNRLIRNRNIFGSLVSLDDD